MGLQDVFLHSDNVSVKQSDKVFTADIEYVVTGTVVLVNLHAAGAEQVRDVIFAEECLGDLEASTTAERSEDVTDTNDGISDNVMIGAKHT